MKKIGLLALAAAAVIGTNAASAQEVTYVEDCSQGLLINRPQNNWFITVQGGANMLFGPHDVHADIQDRIGPQANIFVGKWVTPVFGFRIGASWLMPKGLTEEGGFFRKMNVGLYPDSKYYDEKFQGVGPEFDLLLNLTNWWCGYKPGRVYNAILYAGGSGYFTFARSYSGANHKKGDWNRVDDFVPSLRAGLINQFRITDQVALSLDLRWSAFEKAEYGYQMNSDLQAYLGVTYLFKNREWVAPVVPVCPPAENCDALRARLEAAEGRIADLEAQLKDCLNRPVEKVEAEKAPVATIYYPINVYKLTKKDIGILGAVSEVMKSNPNQHYVLTGWADNFTGTDQFNARLRENRVNGVEKQLLKMGVPQSQITAKTNNGSLCDLGEKYVALDRAVTIEEAE